MNYSKADIVHMLTTNDRAVVRGILAIYKFQTSSEKVLQHTTENNGVGFNGADSRILSSFAQQLNKGRVLSEKQLYIARKKIVKYAGQLARVANQTVTC